MKFSFSYKFTEKGQASSEVLIVVFFAVILLVSVEYPLYPGSGVHTTIEWIFIGIHAWIVGFFYPLSLPIC